METTYGTNQMSDQLVGAARPCAHGVAAAGWLGSDKDAKSAIASDPMFAGVPTTHHRWPRGSQ